MHVSVAKIFFQKSDGHQKFAVISPKHIGTATKRNKCRRWLRDIIRTNIHQLDQTYNIIIIATNKMHTESFDYCKQRIIAGLKRKHLINETITNTAN